MLFNMNQNANKIHVDVFWKIIFKKISENS